MNDDERIATFLGWRQPDGSEELHMQVFDTSADGWVCFGELVAAIEAKGWMWSSDYARYELLASYWADVRIGERTYRGKADNLPEALKLAVLAALEAE